MPNFFAHRLLRKGERESTLINLDDTITSALGLLHFEVVNGSIKIETTMRAAVVSLPLAQQLTVAS